VRSLLIALLLALPAHAAEPAKKADEPMAGKMKKKGMNQGDVKKNAEKKKKEMKPMLEKESRSMERAAPASK
jgi:hypothetical protein